MGHWGLGLWQKANPSQQDGLAICLYIDSSTQNHYHQQFHLTSAICLLIVE